MTRLLILSSILFISCKTDTSKSVENNNSVKIFIDNTQNDSPINLSEIISNLEYQILSTPTSNLIGNVRKIIFNDKYYALLDLARNSIWIFDKNLNYVKEIKITEGRGPNELTYLSDITFGKNNDIYALGLFKILGFNIEQGFINEIRIKPQLYKLTYDSVNSTFIGYMNNSGSPSNTESKTSYNILVLNQDGKVIDKLLPIDERILNLKLMHFNNFPSFSNEQLFFSYLDLNVYSISNGIAQTKYSINFKSKGLDDEVLSKNNESIDNRTFLRKELIANDIARSLATFIESKSFVYGEYFVGRRSEYFFYNKLDSESISGSSLYNDIDHGIKPLFFSAKNDTFIGVIEPQDLIKHIENTKRDGSEKFNELVELSTKLNSYSNPIFVKGY